MQTLRRRRHGRRSVHGKPREVSGQIRLQSLRTRTTDNPPTGLARLVPRPQARRRRRGYAEAVVSLDELSVVVLSSSSLFISVGQTLPSGMEAEQLAMSAGMELSLFMSSETVTNS